YLNNLQTFIFATVLSLFLMFVACSKNNRTVILTNSGKTEMLKPGDVISFGEEHDLIKIRFESLNDSRCPTNVNCVRAGDAIANLTIEDIDQQKQNLTLTIGESSDFKADTIDISIKEKPYRIILENVLPYPESDKQVDKIATFHFYSL